MAPILTVFRTTVDSMRVRLKQIHSLLFWCRNSRIFIASSSIRTAHSKRASRTNACTHYHIHETHKNRVGRENFVIYLNFSQIVDKWRVHNVSSSPFRTIGGFTIVTEQIDYMTFLFRTKICGRFQYRQPSNNSKINKRVTRVKWANETNRIKLFFFTLQSQWLWQMDKGAVDKLNSVTFCQHSISTKRSGMYIRRKTSAVLRCPIATKTIEIGIERRPKHSSIDCLPIDGTGKSHLFL